MWADRNRRVLTALMAMVIAGTTGTGLYALRDEAAYQSSPAITLAEPLPEGSLVATVNGVDDEPLLVEPGMVLELTYEGQAVGHAPCSTLQVPVDGLWVATHSLNGAFGPVGSMFGGSTGDTALEDLEFTPVCPAMDMVGAGPERFRLPLIAPGEPARLCTGGAACFELDYTG